MALSWEDQKISVKEYFHLRASDPSHRYEYIDGDVYMMTGGTIRHSRIGANLTALLDRLLDESPCVVYNSDVCVQVAENLYVCPDVTVSCDPRDSDEHAGEEDLKAVRYPRFVAEVHSPSTTKIDLDEKSGFYQDHSTIQEFLFINTSAPKVRLYRRESGNRWMIFILNIQDEIELTSLDLRFPVADLYKKTRFARRVAASEIAE